MDAKLDAGVTETVRDALSQLTAVLLCGGKGERLRPFTDMLPKALVPLAGEPLLYHLLAYLSNAGVSDFVACLGYKADAIEQFLSQRARPDWHVTSVDSGDVGMTDRLLDARAHVPGRALVCYGDTLANVDLTELLTQHCRTGAIATVSTYPFHSPFGIVDADEDGRVRGLLEKPQLPYWINIGFVVCEPSAFSFMRRGSDMVTFLSAVADAGGLYAYRHTGKHLTVNTERERAEAETNVIEFFTDLGGQ